MNQWEYETICQTLQTAVPALSPKLINSINAVIKSEHDKTAQLAQTTKELEDLKNKIRQAKEKAAKEKAEGKSNGSK